MKCDSFKFSLMDDTGLREFPMIMLNVSKMNFHHDQYVPHVSLVQKALKVFIICIYIYIYKYIYIYIIIYIGNMS